MAKGPWKMKLETTNYKLAGLSETHSQRFHFSHIEHKSLQKETGKEERELRRRRQEDLRRNTYPHGKQEKRKLKPQGAWQFGSRAYCSQGWGGQRGRLSPLRLARERAQAPPGAPTWLRPLRDGLATAFGSDSTSRCLPFKCTCTWARTVQGYSRSRVCASFNTWIATQKNEAARRAGMGADGLQDRVH